MRRKLTLSVVTAAALVIGGLTAPAAHAEEPAENEAAIVQEQYDGYEAEEIVEEGLAEEGLVVEEAEIGPSGIEIVAEAAGNTSDFSFALSLEPGQSYGTVDITDRVDGELVTESFDIAIEESTIGSTVFTLLDPESGESYTYDSTIAQTSVAFVIPIAFAAVSLSTALYYLAIGAAIVIGGVLALEAAKAVAKIIAENNRRSSSNKRDYYPAVLSGSKVFIRLIANEGVGRV